MSLEQTKANLQELIGDRSNAVIALSGKWGTGKSHLWKEVQGSSPDPAVKNALYVSLFGVRDIIQLKLKIVQSSIPDSKGGHVLRDGLTSTWRGASHFLKKLHPGFAAMDEIALMVVPALLRNRFIVIDDIERKHASFSIDEVMGFIDEYTQIYGARILLILNSNKLDDRDVWERLREKVIEHELSLATTPGEALRIALQQHPTACFESISEAIETCKISNIRIIHKIIRTVNRLVSLRPDLTDDVLLRIVPSTVLLTAIHHRGLEAGPDFKFIREFNPVLQLMPKRAAVAPNAEEVNRQQMESSWARLLAALNIRFANDWQDIVIRFLESGLLDEHGTAKILDKYSAGADASAAQERYYRLIVKKNWHPEVSDAALLDEAVAFLPQVHKLTAYEVTGLHEGLLDIPGGLNVADQVVARWIDDCVIEDHREFLDDEGRARKLHPYIAEKFATWRACSESLPSLLECVRAMEQRAFTSSHEKAMKASNPSMYEAEIRRLGGDELRSFMMEHQKVFGDPPMYSETYGNAASHFVSACRNICRVNDHRRLTTVIQRFFAGVKMENLLVAEVLPRPQASG